MKQTMKIQFSKTLALLALVFSASIGLYSCGGNNDTKTTNTEDKTIKNDVIMGAGSSFDYPLFSKMFHEYQKMTGQKVNYQSVGSGAGISQLTHKTVDFGASDAPMKMEQENAAGAPVLHIPVTAGAVVISYNLPSVKQPLKFSPGVLAEIFLGKITKWNDAKIKNDNPGVSLPDKAIVVSHRSDGSGTTSIFTDYLSKVSPEWKEKIGSGTAVNWKTGLGGKGNEGVAGLVKQTPGAIGYVELAYAIQNQMAYASIQNQSGTFIKPTIETVSAAADIPLPKDGKVSLTNTEAANGYPISGFSWVIIYQEQDAGRSSEAKARELLKLIDWMIHDGQKYSADLDYAPLSENAVAVGEKLLQSATYKGKAIFK